MQRWSCFRNVLWLFARALVLVAVVTFANAHPGSGLVVDNKGQLYFVDTGEGVWKIDSQGRLTLIHGVAYHWMAWDEAGHFASSTNLSEFDQGSFERVTAEGVVPALLISSDYPIAVGQDGALYYVPFDPKGPRRLVRRTPAGRRSVFATLPAYTIDEPVHWVNGIATGPDGSLYMTDSDSVLKVDRDGGLSVFRDGIRAPDCSDPLPAVPKLPYLRGLAVRSDGSVYAAANGCRSVILIPTRGVIRTVLKAEPPWAPTGVAVSGEEVFVLEYLHTPGGSREEWVPRIRKITPAGTVATLAAIERGK